MAEQPEVESGNGGGRRWGVAEAWVVGVGAGLVVIALMGAAYSIGYNNGQDDSEPTARQAEKPAAEGEKAEPGAPTAATGPGKELFAQGCGSCHTLADAETTGAVGPSLDTLEPEESTVETAISAGGAGTGAMPAGIYTGKEAEQVAEYVAAVAGEG
jgi:mono/diheme cytochrome c family protein